MDMKPFLEDYDWGEAFGEAMGAEPNAYNQDRRPARPVLGFVGSTEPLVMGSFDSEWAVSA